MPLADAVQCHRLIQDSAYESHWGLRLRPFENVPDPTFYVPSAKHDAAIERMLYGIHARKGIVMLTGEIGSGKILLSRCDLCLYFGRVSRSGHIRRSLVEKVANEVPHRRDNTGAWVMS